ncbi:MAG TPA: hypothetical protein VNE18_10345 [Rhodanobacter sp.]|nr:hypothetical protein [Rhodanobacter sp.]
MTTRYASRKFLLTLLFSVAGVGALFSGKLSGDQYVALVTLVLAVHHTANIMAARGDADLKVGGSE